MSSAADQPSDGRQWYECASSPRSETDVMDARRGWEDELTGIIDRAAQLGIPAWRVTTALGLPPSFDRAR